MLSDSLSPKELVDVFLKENADNNKKLLAQTKLQEKYTCGFCHALAIALHRKFGYEIITSITIEKGEMICFGHVWAVDDKGRSIDIMGMYRTWDDVELVSFGNQTVRNLDEAKLKEYLYGFKFTQARLKRNALTIEADLKDIENEVSDAAYVVDKYLMPLLGKVE